jgi:hypothetical protein
MTMPNAETRSSRGENLGQDTLPGTERENGGSAREQIRGVKDQVVGQARNTLEQARDRARTSLGESKSQVAEQFGTAAEALRRTTEHLRSEDQERIASLTETVARQIDEVANYLRNKDGAAMRTDLENLARRQPALVVGGALVLGLIGARFLKSSQRERRIGSGSARYGREQRFGNGGYDRFSEETEFESDVPGRSSYQGGGYAGA